MDLVSRIKTFMSSQGLTNSQFADSCQISRPTLSQILLGRNKKVSNEIIEKIHSTYPWLNVMWLMFGEGEMSIDPNMQTSALQNPSFRPSETAYSPANQPEIDASAEPVLPLDMMSDKNQPVQIPNPSVTTDQNQEIASGGTTNIGDAIKSFVNSRTGRTASESDVAQSKSGVKRITSIVVFYDDNSFESFLPTSL